jgi:predicted MFS family arabinose efflux permease
VGIALSGATVPFVQELLGPGSWQLAWGLLAAMSLLLGIGPLRLKGEAARANTSAAGSGIALRMKWLLAGYFIFGAGYIGYMTFMIAWVIGRGGGVASQAAFWSVLGLGAIATPWLWSGVLRRLRHGWAFAILCAITAAGAALPLLSGTLPFQLASAALFGCSFFAVVAATTAFARRNFAPQDWAAAIGALTVSFGIGQMIGPLLVGWMNDASGGLNAGLSASAGLLLLAAFVAAWQADGEAREVYN